MTLQALIARHRNDPDPHPNLRIALGPSELASVIAQVIGSIPAIPAPAAAIPNPVAFGGSASVGGATRYAREDHAHALNLPSALMQLASASAVGIAFVIAPSVEAEKSLLGLANLSAILSHQTYLSGTFTTGPRTFTLPDQNGTFALLEREQTFTARQHVTGAEPTTVAVNEIALGNGCAWLGGRLDVFGDLAHEATAAWSLAATETQIGHGVVATGGYYYSRTGLTVNTQGSTPHDLAMLIDFDPSLNRGSMIAFRDKRDGIVTGHVGHDTGSSLRFSLLTEPDTTLDRNIYMLPGAQEACRFTATAPTSITPNCSIGGGRALIKTDIGVGTTLGTGIFADFNHSTKWMRVRGATMGTTQPGTNETLIGGGGIYARTKVNVGVVGSDWGQLTPGVLTLRSNLDVNEIALTATNPSPTGFFANFACTTGHMRITGADPSTVGASEIRFGGGVGRFDGSVYVGGGITNSTAASWFRCYNGPNLTSVEFDAVNGVMTFKSTASALPVAAPGEAYIAGGAALFTGSSPSAVSNGEVAIGGGNIWSGGDITVGVDGDMTLNCASIWGRKIETPEPGNGCRLYLNEDIQLTDSTGTYIFDWTASTGVFRMLGSAPQSVSAGQVAIGGGLLMAPGSTTGPSAMFGGLELQSYAQDNSWIGSNLYYDSGWKYRANGYGSMVRLGDGNGNVYLYNAPLNAAGPGASAAVQAIVTLAQDGTVTLANRLDIGTGDYAGAGSASLYKTSQWGTILTAAGGTSGDFLLASKTGGIAMYLEAGTNRCTFGTDGINVPGIVYVSGTTTCEAARWSHFGYSTGYPVVQIGRTAAAVTLGNLDITGNASGSFNGNGYECLTPREYRFLVPSAANNNYECALKLSGGGAYNLPTLEVGSASIAVRGYVSATGDFWLKDAQAADANLGRYISFQNNDIEKGWIGYGWSAYGRMGIYNTIGDIYIGSSTGVIAMRSVPYVWPAANAAGVLTNDGSGNLSWAAGGGGGVSGSGSTGYLPAWTGASALGDSRIKNSSDGTYGSIQVSSDKGGYAGIRFSGSNNQHILMVHATQNLNGMYSETSGWSWYWLDGVLTAGTVPYARTTGCAQQSWFGRIDNSSYVDITGATTATRNAMHRVYGTSANYTITLPTSGVTEGDVVGFHVLEGANASKQYTIFSSVGNLGEWGSYLVLVRGNTLTLRYTAGRWTPIVCCLDTPWISGGALVITSNGISPTKGTVSVDSYYWRRKGSTCEVKYTYKQTGAGNAGTGHYTIALPFSADTGKHSVYTGTTWTDAISSSIGGGIFQSTSVPNPLYTFPFLYDASNIRVYAATIYSGNYYVFMFGQNDGNSLSQSSVNFVIEVSYHPTNW